MDEPSPYGTGIVDLLVALRFIEVKVIVQKPVLFNIMCSVHRPFFMQCPLCLIMSDKSI